MIKKNADKSIGSSKKIIIYALLGIIALVAVSLFLVRDDKGVGDTSVPNRVVESTNAAIQRFEKQFCGLESKPNSNEYVIEIKLPNNCEMPLGIVVDTNSSKVWYVSTKKGSLGSYDLNERKFDKEHIIPFWKSRENPIESSQVWTLKLDRQGDIWFTDEKQNSIWRYNKSSSNFEMYKIPSRSKYFGTTYPVSLDFDSNGNVYFVGIRSQSLWFGNITEMTNNTSEGISEIAIPLERFKGIDPDLVSTGSLAVDNRNNAVWISMLAFGKKGQIFRYSIANQTFDIFTLPRELNSPVGIALDNSSNLWITDHGTSLFFKLDPNNKNITKFVTSRPSARILGDSNGATRTEAYTLPYWIQKADDGSLWFNEHTGNKIAHFNPNNLTLIEYWIPSQNKLFSKCKPESTLSCGIANALQFAIGKKNGTETQNDKNSQVWFTEWSENKIAKIETEKNLAFSIYASPQEVTVKKGDSAKIDIIIRPTIDSPPSIVNMTASAAFSPTGDFGSSTWSFNKESISIKDERMVKLSFIITPSVDLKAGKYILMLGAENSAVTYVRAIALNII